MFNELPKLSEVVAKDDLRPIMCHAYMTRQYIYASESHILVRLNTAEHFDERQVSLIPDDGMYLDVWTLRHLQRQNIEKVDILDQPNLIEIRHKSGETVYYPWKTEFDVGSKYPNCAQVISEVWNVGKYVPMSQISFKAQLMLKLQEGLGDKIGLNCYLNGEDNGIYVLPATNDLIAQGRIGILMPIENRR